MNVRVNVTMKYSVEHVLGALFELRDYPRLAKRVDFLISSRGWSHIVWALRKCRDSDAIVPGWDLHLREGILREGMIELLGLNEFIGLDIDFLEEFANLEADTLKELQTVARPRAIDLLREQVKRGNTFFLDVEAMKNEDLVVIVPDILEARIREVRELGRSPDLYEVYSTYYGFQILTTGVNSQQAGVRDELRENLLNVLGEVGEVDTLHAKQLKFSSLAFRNCSHHLTVLLWNMLRFAKGGKKAKVKALEALGELGDSRAIELIHTYIDAHGSARQGTIERGILRVCLLCLGRIGNPRSFEYVRRGGSDSIVALSGIRHPEVRQTLEELTHRYRHGMIYGLSGLLQVLSNTRSRTWFDFYERMRKKQRSRKIQEAVEHAEKNVHPPFDF